MTTQVAPAVSQPTTKQLPAYVSLVTLLPIYQRALLASAEGKRFNGRVLDMNRVGRAFFMVAYSTAQARIAHYNTTTRGCECEDWRGNNLCKHVISYWLIVRCGEVSNG